MFLPQVSGQQLITIENLKSPDGVLHPVQQAMIDTNGSQCGFCTPGIVMSLFALYKGKKKPDREDIEKALSGNLCRCTGYVPIMEAAEMIRKMKKRDHFSQNEAKTIKRLQSIDSKSLALKDGNQKYYCPQSIKEALKLRKKHSTALLLSGATDIALRVTKNHEALPIIIELSSIYELKGIFHRKNSTEIMTGTTLNEIMPIAKSAFPALFDTLTVFGSDQIRNLATIGGNLATASPIGDIAPVLIAYNAKIVLISQKKKRQISIENFLTGYRKTAIRKNELVYSIIIPHVKKDVRIRFYKFSKRKELDISTVSAGFRLELTKNNKVRLIKLVYGGMALMTKRALKTEKFLKEKDWNHDSVVSAGDLLGKDFSPISDARATAEGRMIAAKNLLLKFYCDTTNEKKANETKRPKI
jgi:xanthine dehydrogenase small subunit